MTLVLSIQEDLILGLSKSDIARRSFSLRFRCKSPIISVFYGLFDIKFFLIGQQVPLIWRYKLRMLMGCSSFFALYHVFHQSDVIKTRLRRQAIFFTEHFNFLLKPPQDKHLLRQGVFFKPVSLESTFETFSKLFFANHLSPNILYGCCLLIEKCGECVVNLV